MIISNEKFSIHSPYFSYYGIKPYWLSFNNLSLRQIGIRTIKNAEIIGQGIVLDSKGVLQLESTIFQKEYLFKLNSNHKVYFRRFFPSFNLDKAIVLSNYLENNYYHWMMESVARLMLIPPEKLKYYKIIINSKAPKFAEETLTSLFSIAPENIFKNSYTRVKVPELLILSFPHTRDDVSNYTNVYYPTVIKRINTLSKFKTIPIDSKRNFVIARGKATQRRILNIELISEYFPNENFEIIFLEDLTFAQQMHLFRNAGIIITTHGAGLVNLLFSENPIVIEFFPTNRTNRDAFYFYQITQALQIKHTIIEYQAENAEQDLLLNENHLNTVSKILVQMNT
jgi:capsular polysaccharide biosynthesis protein